MSVNNVAFPGRLVVKTAQALPQTATANLFVVGGGAGAYLVTGLVGVITTAIGATVTSLALGTTAAAGGSTSSIMTSTAITSKTVGTWILPSSASGVGGAPVFVTSGAVFVQTTPYASTPFLVSPGCSITWTTTASTTGNISWYLWYIPIDADTGLS